MQERLLSLAGEAKFGMSGAHIQITCIEVACTERFEPCSAVGQGIICSFREWHNLFWDNVSALKRAQVCWFGRAACCLLSLLGLLGEKHGLDVGQDTSLGDGDSRQELVQLLVVTDGQLEMTGDDPGLLVVTGSVSCELKNLSSQVFHDCCQVDWGTGSNALGIVSLAKVTVDSADGELQTGTG